MINDLNENNFLIFAMKAYSTPNCVLSEFEEDIKRIKYIKRLIRKYKVTGILKERLILNHIIVLSNVFGTEASVRMLFYRVDYSDYDVLKTFLLYLNYMPKIVRGIKGRDIHSGDITIDIEVAKQLKTI
jgi:hypothetical protein